MGENSAIAWTDSTWNPVRGCTRVSPGCGGPGKNGGCYAEAMAARFSAPGIWGHGFAEMKNGEPRWTGKVELIEQQLMLPMKWKRPQRIFVNSTSDMFHEFLPDEAIERVFTVMALCSRHTFQILTKRSERMQRHITRIGRSIETLERHARAMGYTLKFEGIGLVAWPLPNVWLGVSCEDQERADERIPDLLATPATIRFVSLEPLLGPICLHPLSDGTNALTSSTGPNLNWAIVGGESGPRARSFDLAWARSLRDQCAAAGVAYFQKQLGARPVRQYPGDPYQLMDRRAGADPNEWPDDLRVQNFPEALR